MKKNPAQEKYNHYNKYTTRDAIPTYTYILTNKQKKNPRSIY